MRSTGKLFLMKFKIFRGPMNHGIQTKDRTPENKLVYNKQKKFAYHQYEKLKRAVIANLIKKTVTDSKLFWKMIKPFSSDKGARSQKITLIEENEMIGTGVEIFLIFNNYLSGIVSSLNIPRYEDPS